MYVCNNEIDLISFVWDGLAKAPFRPKKKWYTWHYIATVDRPLLTHLLYDDAMYNLHDVSWSKHVRYSVTMHILKSSTFILYLTN